MLLHHLDLRKFFSNNFKKQTHKCFCMCKTCYTYFFSWRSLVWQPKWMFLVGFVCSPLPSVVLQISFLEIKCSYQMNTELYGLKLGFADVRALLLFVFFSFHVTDSHISWKFETFNLWSAASYVYTYNAARDCSVLRRNRQLQRWGKWRFDLPH